MSGGSLDYLYSRLPDHLMEHHGNLQTAEAHLRELGQDQAADLVAGLRLNMGELARRAVVLSDLLQAVEWHLSCDWGPDQVLQSCHRLKAGGDRAQYVTHRLESLARDLQLVRDQDLGPDRSDALTAMATELLACAERVKEVNRG